MNIQTNIRTTRPASVPARIVLRQAEATNAALGHVNLGALSESHGFISAAQPIVDLPRPFDAWTDAAASLPQLCDRMIVRRALDRLPVLDPSLDALPDTYLMRASSVIGVLAHAYGNIELTPPERIPDAITLPWDVLAWRLDKPRWTLTTNDYMWHNWRLIDPSAPRPMRVENMDVLTPVWNNPGLNLFMLVVLELLAQSTPLIGAVVRAQEAVAERNDAGLKAELALMSDVLKGMAFETLLKANPNRHSGDRYVDPVVWGNTFSAFPSALRPGVHNATGVETPSLHMMDEFLGRRGYNSQLGSDAQVLRAAYPLHWRRFIAAVRQVSVPDYVQASGDRELHGLFREAREAYQGRDGLFARHRLKAFTYLDAAFKTGWRAQVAGFAVMFKDRSWDLLDTTFEKSRTERDEHYRSDVSFARIARVEDAGPASQAIRRVVFDVRGLGIRYAPGDRLSILPENSPDLVARTLTALDADGDEEIALDRSWSAAVAMHEGHAAARTLRLSELLAFGHVRPVTRDVAKRLQALTHSERLHRLLHERMEDQLELWDLLEQLKLGGFQPTRLLSALPGEPHHICRVVPPMAPRLYSISSAPLSAQAVADEIELTVGPMAYESLTAHEGRPERRLGTASTFLCDGRMATRGSVAVRVVHPPRFSLPADPSTPIIMFAAGTGIAPFRGFLEARARAACGRNVLVLSVRDVDSICYRSELEALQAAGKLDLHVAVSRQPVRPVFDRARGCLNMAPGEACRVDGLLRDRAIAQDLRQLVLGPEHGGQGAVIYVCGRATFAVSVLEAVVGLLGEGASPEEAHEDGYRALYRMIGANRYMQDVFTTYTGSTATKERHVDVSELILRNTPEAGLWQAIGGRVYDVTRFAQMHPGGAKILQSYAGLDATAAYQKVDHHRNPEVDSMLAMFELGVMRRLDFGMEWTVTAGENGLQFMLLSTLFRSWVRFVYLFVEIENAYAAAVSIREEAIIPPEPGEDPLNSAFNLQFQILAHHRFLAEALAYLSEELAKLWRRTAGACDPAAELRWLERELASLRESTDAQDAVRWGDELQRLNSGLASLQLQNWRLHVRELQAADAALLTDFKTALGRGLRVFETHEREALRRGSGTLLAALRSLPPVLRTYYGRLKHLRLTSRH